MKVKLDTVLKILLQIKMYFIKEGTMLCSVHSLLSHLEGAMLLIGGLVDKNTYSTYRRAFQPAAWKAIFCGPRSQMLPCICWIFEIMKPEQPILWSFGSINPLLFLLWVTLILVKILQKIYKMPLILLHAARLMIRLIGGITCLD